MRASGAGGSDRLMTVVPLGMLVLVIVWISGGPKASLAWIENFLRALGEWVAGLAR
jgi:hypothetical protein